MGGVAGWKLFDPLRRAVNKIEASGWKLLGNVSTVVDKNVAQPLLTVRNTAVDKVAAVAEVTTSAAKTVLSPTFLKLALVLGILLAFGYILGFFKRRAA
jgi:hypothetical protein